MACSEQKILVFQQELEVENNAIAEFHKQPLATPLSISKKIEGNTEITTAVDRMVRDYFYFYLIFNSVAYKIISYIV